RKERADRMGNYERFVQVINGQRPDRILTYDFMVSKQLLAKFGGFDESKNYSFKEIVEMNARTFKAIALDAACHIYNPARPWISSKIDNWARFLGVNSDGWEVTRKAGTDWIAKKPFSNLKELEKNLPELPRYEEVRGWYEPIFKHIKEVFDYYDLVFIGAVEGPVSDSYMYAGMELFMTAIYDAPKMVSHILDCTALLSTYIAQVFAESELGPMLFMGEDIACDTGAIFNPKFIVEQGLPRWRQISEPIRKKGFRLLFHSDGRYGELLPIIFDEFGADGLNPIERNGCNDIFEIRKRYPDKLLFGNVCCSVTLPAGNVYDVEDETLELIERIGPGGGVLIGSSGEVGDSVPAENAEAMYKVVHEYGKYPIDTKRIGSRRSEIRDRLKTRRSELLPG
ncbi:MAG: uroporphyrinogen decarboxylase family protein, partial [Phycisphaerae bacterium]|nr:uroporphyrinogen decarboxylase family protein [Phycisphaerae bacterium]